MPSTLGGNDIKEDIVVRDLFDSIMSRVQRLRELHVRVLVGEILPRASYGLRGVYLETFEKIRKAVNKKLRRAMSDKFIFFRVCLLYRGGGVHYYYDESDGAHLSDSGMWRYHRTLVDVFTNYQW